MSEYRDASGALRNVRALVNGLANIRVCNGLKTFEYDVALSNLGRSAVVTEAMEKNVLMAALSKAPDILPIELAELLEDEVTNDLEAINNIDERNVIQFATLYLMCAEGAKGEHAFALEGMLAKLDPTTLDSAFTSPRYICEAIEWVTDAPTTTPSATPAPAPAL